MQYLRQNEHLEVFGKYQFLEIKISYFSFTVLRKHIVSHVSSIRENTVNYFLKKNLKSINKKLSRRFCKEVSVGLKNMFVFLNYLENAIIIAVL